jgi:hypothetical protein
MLAGLLVGAWTVPALGSPFGVCAHTPAPRIQDAVTEAGIRWVRIDLVWAFVEFAPDAYDWTFYDRLFDQLEARGLDVMVTVAGTPGWATSGSEFSGAPDDPNHFREFCYLAAARYHDRIDAWGFWNEPNLDHFWEGGRHQYIDEILIPGIEAVRAVDPQARVVGPDLAHLISADWDDWLDDVVSATRHLLDVVTHHVYPSDGSAGNVTEKLAEGGQFPWDPPSVRSVLRDAGWHDRPFWLTETGVRSGVEGEAGQARFYRDLLDDWFAPNRSHSWIDRVFFYEINDGGVDPALTWGILHPPPELEPKAAYFAYSDFIATAEVDDASIRITGLPRFMGSQQRVDLSLEVTNTGTTTWRAEDDYYLIFDVEIPGWVHESEPVAVDRPVEPGETVIVPAVLGSPFTSQAYPAREVPILVRMSKIGSGKFGDAPNRSVTHTAHIPAAFERQPMPVVSHINGRAVFSIEAESDTEMSYRWRRNTAWLTDDHEYAGTNSPELTVTGIGFDDLGDYDCVVTNSAGSSASQPASLTLSGSPVRRPSDRRVVPTTSAMDRWHAFKARGSARYHAPTARPDARRGDSSR